EDLTRATLYVPNRFTLDWIRAQYAGRIASLLELISGQAITVELALAQRAAPVRSHATPKSSPAQTQGESAPTQRPDNAAASNPPRNRLNPGLTFDTLVEGTANRMARAAAMHVAGMPGHLYNPLFIYGGVGLGKTHLVHAVGNK